MLRLDSSPTLCALSWPPVLALAIPATDILDRVNLLVAILATLLLCAGVILQGAIHSRARQAWLRSGAPGPPGESPRWPGFRPFCGILGLVVLVLGCYHVGFGAAPALVGKCLGALLMGAACGASAAAMFALVSRSWSVNLADVGLALFNVAACCVAVALLPGQPGELALRYPLIFNAVLAALAVLTWFWCWLSRVWEQQLDGGVAWTTTGRMIGPARRVAFFAAVLALLVGWLMTVWPRLPGVSTMDDSFGRIAAGIAGHLALLWAALSGARRTRQPGFVVLALLTVAGMLAFVYVRSVPLTTAAF